MCVEENSRGDIVTVLRKIAEVTHLQSRRSPSWLPGGWVGSVNIKVLIKGSVDKRWVGVMLI